jgi:hypothetical protein
VAYPDFLFEYQYFKILILEKKIRISHLAYKIQQFSSDELGIKIRIIEIKSSKIVNDIGAC